MCSTLRTRRAQAAITGSVNLPLYLSASPEWAIMAISGYMREDGRRRVVVPLLVSTAFALDQHDQQACERLGIDRNASNLPWRPALAAGEEPPSWRTANVCQSSGC